MNFTANDLLLGLGFVVLYKTIKRFFYDDEGAFWENHPFEDVLETADDLCEIGYAFQKNEVVYKKISEKAWFVKILIPNECPFDIGHEFMIEDYLYKKIGEKAWTIEKCD